MRYESQKTPQGNVGVSYTSQTLADAQAVAMDASYCQDCSNCSDCAHCQDCSNCSGVLQWTGPATQRLLTLNGLMWPASTDGVNLQIGCQQHTVKAWDAFTDGQIAKMASEALDFWTQFKPTIMAMATYRRTI